MLVRPLIDDEISVVSFMKANVDMLVEGREAVEFDKVLLGVEI